MFRPSGTPQYNPKFPKKYSSKLTEFESVICNHVKEYDNSNAFFRNSQNEEDLYVYISKLVKSLNNI